MKKRLTRDFFKKKTALSLARSLLGCALVHETEHGCIVGTIYETEAYCERDEASHTFNKRRTKRNEVMFSDGGHLYVYFTYGMHHCLNIVAGPADFGAAVLVRSVQLTDGFSIARTNRMRPGKRIPDRHLTDGPGKLCAAFGITLRNNGCDTTDLQSSIYLLPAARRPVSVLRTKRIGISKGTEALWRFVARL